MAKWSVMLVLALVLVHTSARNVPADTTVATSTAPSSVPSGAGVEDQKNFLTYGGVGGFSGIGSNGLPFGGVGGLGGVTPLGGAGGLGGLGGGIGGIGGVTPLGGVGGTGTGVVPFP
ncbi:hypothetical protein DITRI_Ditri13aG0112700 [Diplodiscus trichospermus]